MEGDRRRGEDTGRRPARLTALRSAIASLPQRIGRAVAVRSGSRAGVADRARRGPWRVAVADRSMEPAIRPGDWLLVDPTSRVWPRRGSAVVFSEPGSDVLAIKRVVARPGDWIRFAGGWLHLGPDEAWLLGDATDEALATAGSGGAIDSRRYGPVPLERLVGRVWLRYAPLRRVGRIPSAPAELRNRSAASPSPFAKPDVGPPADLPRS